ncbi:ribosome assembly RNA-binding protein YhbY [bacterium]|nr:ribosome assembly RNA-binding protein YhbY [bacterium]
MELTGKQKKYLQGIGNSIKSTVSVGKSGVSDNTFVSVNNAFNTKELIKIKIQDGCEEIKEDVAMKIERGTNAVLVQIIGRTLLFFKPNRDNPKIELP